MSEPDILPDLKGARLKMEKLRVEHGGDDVATPPAEGRSTQHPLSSPGPDLRRMDDDGSVAVDDASLTSLSMISQITPAGGLSQGDDGGEVDENSDEGEGSKKRLDEEDGEGEGGIVEGADGGSGGSSLEGSNATGGSRSRKSLKRAPTDPSKFNAVTVHLCFATGIRKWDASCDPFALVTVGKAKTTFEEKLAYMEQTGYHDSLYETRVIENTTEPEWNEVCTLGIPPGIEKAEIHVQVQDKDMGANEDLGEVSSEEQNDE